MNIKEQLKAHFQVTGAKMSKDNTPEEIAQAINDYLESNGDQPYCGVANLSETTMAYLTEQGYKINDEGMLEYVGVEEAPIVNKITKAKQDTDGKVKSLKDIKGNAKNVIEQDLPQEKLKIKKAKTEKLKEAKPKKERNPSSNTGWIPDDNGDRMNIIQNTKVTSLQFRDTRVSLWIEGVRVAKIQGGRLYFQRVEKESVVVTSYKDVVAALNSVSDLVGGATPRPKKSEAEPKPKAEKKPASKKKVVEQVVEEEVIYEEASEDGQEDAEEEFEWEDEDGEEEIEGLDSGEEIEGLE